MRHPERSRRWCHTLLFSRREREGSAPLLLRGYLPPDSRTSVWLEFPTGTFLPLQAEISPVGILGEDQGQPLLATPCLDLDFTVSRGSEIRVFLIPDEHVITISGSEAVWVELTLVPDDTRIISLVKPV
jgi:hypothetical protein